MCREAYATQVFGVVGYPFILFCTGINYSEFSVKLLGVSVAYQSEMGADMGYPFIKEKLKPRFCQVCHDLK